MANTYTTSLKLLKQGTGDNAGNWGSLVNTELTDLVDTAVAGYVSITMASANYTLSNGNGSAANESRNMYINVSGTIAATQSVICPSVSKLYFVANNTAGGFAITFKTSAGTGVLIPNGTEVAVMCDGTNVIPATTALIGDNSATSTTAGAVRVTGGANSSTGAGGLINITGGAAASGGAGGSVVVNGGTSSTGAGGGVTITGGVTATTGSSGPISITGGAAGTGNTPGAVSITGGAGASSGAATAGGLVTITGGASGNFGSGLAGGGAVNITGGAGNTLLASGTPGAVVIAAGAASITGQAGANVSITASNAFVAATNANGGSVNITSGQSAFTGGITGNVNINAGSSGGGAGGAAIVFNNAGTESARIDKAGNVGIGATPSTGGFAWKLLEIGQAGSGVAGGYGETDFINNLRGDRSGGWSFVNTAYAARYSQSLGVHSWFSATGTAAAQFNPTAAMVLDASGNLGIGGTPTYKVDIVGTTADINTNIRATTGAAYHRAANTGGWSYFGQDSSLGNLCGTAYGAMVWSNTTGGVIFGTNNTERMQLSNSGALLLGTASTTLTNSNGIVISPIIKGIIVQHDTTTASGTLYANFTYNTTSIGSISQNSTTGVLFNVSSDARLKTNVVNAPDASVLIDSIQVRSFDWVSDNSHQRYGMVAQELIQVAPEAVYSPANSNEMMGVDYSKLVPMLIKEVQSLRARVAALEAL